ncbi:hypothetical protein [Salisediminibacterium halotolerans]|uniref:Uncharacterized protein n=1 Tax=Salisediminibacterium halotolerans TaxID=517425 RepID=A0A1H9SK17_9BACI|nr:hypothetical protein [Salisediminibacterium haloalkalitolerans]SER84589.1 hypothetical protein SAMN05444126_10711 [Salisediminibacterium haloalkalitolerans]
MKHLNDWRSLQRLPREKGAKEATWRKIEERLNEHPSRKRPNFKLSAIAGAAVVLLTVLIWTGFPETEQQSNLLPYDQFEDLDHIALSPGDASGADFILERYTETTFQTNDSILMDRLLTPLIESAEKINDEHVDFEPSMHLLAASAETEGTLIYLDPRPEKLLAATANSPDEIYELPADYSTDVKQLYEFRPDLEAGDGQIVEIEEADSLFHNQEIDYYEIESDSSNAVSRLHKPFYNSDNVSWITLEKADIPNESEEVSIEMELNGQHYRWDLTQTQDNIYFHLDDGTVLVYDEEEIGEYWRAFKDQAEPKE